MKYRDKIAEEMDQEELNAEPSLDKMVDLSDPKVLEGLGRLATMIMEENQAKQKKK